MNNLRATANLCVLLVWLAIGAGCAGGPNPGATARPATPAPVLALTTTPGAALLPPTSSPATAQPTTPIRYATSTPAATSAPQVTLHLVGYFFGSNHDNHVSDISAGQLTDVLYAFADVTRTGDCAADNPATDQINVPQLQQLKRQHPALKVLISLGGASHSTYFSDAALTVDSRRRFVQSCVQFMRQREMDGIDVDWELPVSGGPPGTIHRPEDKQNFTALLAEFRRQLDTLAASEYRRYLLTIAGPAGSASEYATMDFGMLQQYLDWINLESYAYATASSPITSFIAPLYDPPASADSSNTKRTHYSADMAVRAYRAMGVPAGKIVLGVPFYGRGWAGVPGANNGLYEPNTGPATDAAVPKGTWNVGVIFYRDIAAHYLDSYSRFWQADAAEPWLYSPNTRILITYDDPQSLGGKADYVKNNGLGGVMIWHVSADDSHHALLNALYTHLFP